MGQARNAETGEVIAERVRCAHTHWTRLKGLLGTRSFEPGNGLWIKPCQQVHMIGMRYPVDLVFLDDGGRVVRTIGSLAPNRISPKVADAASVLELPAGTIAGSGLAPGATVEIDVDAALAGDWLDAGAAVACNLALAALYALFAAVHVAHARRTGQWATAMPIVLQEAILVGLFLARRRSIAASRRVFDWAVGIAGTFLPLSFRASESMGRLYWLGAPLQIGGLGWAILGAVSLGRSLAIVAGNRGLKTAGLYRFVRHPMYAGYLVSYTGYVAAYPSARNTLILAATSAALVARAWAEERFLASEVAYREYLRRIPWRFIPYVY